MPSGPITIAPGVPSMSPEIRTGASIPRWIASVNASSTCDSFRSGPSTRTFGSGRRRGPSSVTVSAAA